MCLVLAECLGLPLFRRQIEGSSKNQALDYEPTLDDEVLAED